MPLDPAALNALTNQWAIDRANLDDQENRSRINYQQALEKMRRQNDEASGNLSVGMADRGLGQSGIRMGGMIKQQDAYNQAQGTAAQSNTLDLATIARKRLEADAAYNAQRALLEAGIPTT
jgi:hypothetical protein